MRGEAEAIERRERVLGGRMGCTGDRESRVWTGEWQAKELAVAPEAWSCHHNGALLI